MVGSEVIKEKMSEKFNKEHKCRLLYEICDAAQNTEFHTQVAQQEVLDVRA